MYVGYRGRTAPPPLPSRKRAPCRPLHEAAPEPLNLLLRHVVRALGVLHQNRVCLLVRAQIFSPLSQELLQALHLAL